MKTGGHAGAKREGLGDAEARARIKDDLGSTLVVEAAAGTGKTTALVGRILSLLLRGDARLSGLVAVTFTEKAAGEMKLRLRAEIERARADETAKPDERARLDAALAELEAARMSTIHGFCADLLRERAVEAGVDPLFEVADGAGQLRLFRQAFDPWFQAVLGAQSEGAARVLRRRPRGRFAQGPRHALLRAGLDLAEVRDFDAPWRRPPFDRKKALDDALARLRALGALHARAADKRSYLAQSLEAVARFVHEVDGREAVSGARDYDGLEPLLAAHVDQRLWGWKGGTSFFAPGLPKAAVLTQRDETKAFVLSVLAACEADLAACLREELRPVIAAYEREKTRAGRLDFFDLLLRTRDLLARDGLARRELQERFTHILVDEFQDTDPLQAEILLLLAADDPAVADPARARPKPGKLFIVGDPKQSIYRFRRADVALYESIKRRLCADGASLLHLTTSFRAQPALQRWVNDAFAPLMTAAEDGHQADYVPLEPMREDETDQPHVVALPVPRCYGNYGGKVAAWRVSESTPDAVAAFVDWLLRSSGWKVADGGARVPVESRHVCLLFKRFQVMGEDVTRPYVRALEARRVPHVLLGGRSFHEREEVLALRVALAAVEWPDDELSVYATLRGPLLALGDDALLVWRARHGSLHPMRRAPPEALDDATRPVADALALIASLHRGRNRRPIADTIARLLEATRAHAGLAIWPTGEQALANVLRMTDMARRFEAEPATSFRAFVAMLEDDAEEGEVPDAPVVEEGTEGVRMMTVHRAKGLEFPVVVLVDPAANPHPARPSRWVDPERRVWALPLAGCAPAELHEHAGEALAADWAEAVRLLYVATTRARDLIVVPAVADEPLDKKWLQPLYPVLYPKESKRGRPARAPGCPPMGGDTVLDRPGGVSAQPLLAGLHESGVGGHPIVWWDLARLELDKEEEAGLRQQRILAADQGELAAALGERQYGAWREARAAALAAGAAPTLRVESVTRLAPTAKAPCGAAIALERTGAPREGRPRGKRFGSLVHAVLATAPLDADAAAVLAHARTQARMFGATEDEAAHAASAASAALEHPLLLRARGARDVRRETPACFVAEDGVLVEGVVDLAFLDGDGWVVVDFKTDAEIDASRPVYERQVALYVEAITKATGAPARGALLMV